MCKDNAIIYNRIVQRRRMDLPDIPKESWCDFRVDYESGMTLKAIGCKYVCDPRTVRKCILANRSSTEIGKWLGKTKVGDFVIKIDALYRLYTSDPDHIPNNPGICEISGKIAEELRAEGYTGGERTVRNYLRSHYEFVSDSADSEEDNSNA